MNVKLLLKWGGVAGAVMGLAGLVSGFIAVLRPLELSDSPPLAGIPRVVEIDGKLATLAQNQQQFQLQFQQSVQTQLFLAQGFWTQQLVQAEIELRTHPNNFAAQQQRLNAQQQLDGIRRRLK